MRYTALLPILLCACATGPRVITVEERDTAQGLLSAIDTAITAAAIAGKIPAEDAQLAHAQVAALRSKVDAATATPVYWTDLLNDVLLMASAWAVRAD